MVLEYVFDSIYVDLQYHISLTFTAGCVSLCCVLVLCPCVVSVFMWSSLDCEVVMVTYMDAVVAVTVMRVLFVLHVRVRG